MNKKKNIVEIMQTHDYQTEAGVIRVQLIRSGLDYGIRAHINTLDQQHIYKTEILPKIMEVFNFDQ